MNFVSFPGPTVPRTRRYICSQRRAVPRGPADDVRGHEERVPPRQKKSHSSRIVVVVVFVRRRRIAVGSGGRRVRRRGRILLGGDHEPPRQDQDADDDGRCERVRWIGGRVRVEDREGRGVRRALRRGGPEGGVHRAERVHLLRNVRARAAEDEEGGIVELIRRFFIRKPPGGGTKWRIPEGSFGGDGYCLDI